MQETECRRKRAMHYESVHFERVFIQLSQIKIRVRPPIILRPWDSLL